MPIPRSSFAGYVFVDAKDLDEAIAWAKRCTSTIYGSIEDPPGGRAQGNRELGRMAARRAGIVDERGRARRRAYGGRLVAFLRREQVMSPGERGRAVRKHSQQPPCACGRPERLPDNPGRLVLTVARRRKTDATSGRTPRRATAGEEHLT